MALISGQRITYGYDNTATTYDGTNEALDISGALSTLNPYDYPLLAALGSDGFTPTQVKHEWLEDEHAGMSATSTDTDLNDADANSTVITLATAGDYLKFRAGTIASASADIVRISSTAGSELAPVTTSVSNDITVTRGAFSGSSPVDHTGYTKTITVIGRFQPQGLTTVGASITTIKANKYNYTQIYEDSYKASATQQSTAKFTAQDDRAYEFSKMMVKASTLLERSWLFGTRTAHSATSGGTAAGIRETISTNAYAKAGAALTQTHLEDALVDIAQAGGDGSYLAVVGSIQQRRINTFLDGYREVDYSDEVLGTAVRRYKTNFGSVDVLLDRHMPTDEVWILDEEKIGFGPLNGRALATTKLPPLSREYDVWQISGEYVSEVHLEAGHARIHTLATTGLF